MRLIRDINLTEPDATYNALIEVHRGLSASESAALNARLVLVLINHIGDDAVIKEALAVAGAAASAEQRQQREC
jgi:hypothetical protein